MQNEECRIWRALTFHCALFTLNLKTGCNVSSRRPPSEGGGRECNSLHPDHFWKAGRYKLAAPVSKTGSAQTRGRSITDAFRHFGHVPTLNRNNQRKETYATCYPLPKPVALS